MPILRIFIISTSFILSFNSFAEGAMGSGGGKGIVCFDNLDTANQVRIREGVIFDKDISSIISIEPQDLRYAKQIRGFNGRPASITTILEDESFDDYIHKLLLASNRISSEIKESIVKYSNEFQGDQLIFRDGPLKPMNDDKDVGLYESEKCTITTLAIQHSLNGRVYLNIDQRLFTHPHHSRQGQATLLLHEYVYATYRENGANNSLEARETVFQLLNGL